MKAISPKEANSQSICKVKAKNEVEPSKRREKWSRKKKRKEGKIRENVYVIKISVKNDLNNESSSKNHLLRKEKNVVIKRAFP